MIRGWWFPVLLLLTACGSKGGPPGGYVNPFVGTCLEKLFACFQASGQATCTYSPSGLRTLTYPNGAKVTSASGGTQENRCFGPTGTYCFTVTRSADPTIRTYRGMDVQDVTVVDTGQGDTIEVRCPNQAPATVTRPFQNPAEQDLSAWSPCASG